MCWKPAFCAHRVWRNSSFYPEVQRSVCDCRDGGFPWTTRLHQILLFQVRGNGYRMPVMWLSDLTFFFFFFFFSSGPRACAPDAPQPSGLLWNPLVVLNVPTFSASPPSRPCYPREPWQRKVELRGRETWLTILSWMPAHLGIFYMPQIFRLI